MIMLKTMMITVTSMILIRQSTCIPEAGFQRGWSIRQHTILYLWISLLRHFHVIWVLLHFSLCTQLGTKLEFNITISDGEGEGKKDNMT